jgi:hypothetical protein
MKNPCKACPVVNGGHICERVKQGGGLGGWSGPKRMANQKHGDLKIKPKNSCKSGKGVTK